MFYLAQIVCCNGLFIYLFCYFCQLHISTRFKTTRPNHQQVVTPAQDENFIVCSNDAYGNGNSWLDLSINSRSLSLFCISGRGPITALLLFGYMSSEQEWNTTSLLLALEGDEELHAVRCHGEKHAVRRKKIILVWVWHEGRNGSTSEMSQSTQSEWMAMAAAVGIIGSKQI